jgi:enediyne biosynthesis protein E4
MTMPRVTTTSANPVLVLGTCAVVALLLTVGAGCRVLPRAWRAVVPARAEAAAPVAARSPEAAAAAGAAVVPVSVQAPSGVVVQDYALRPVPAPLPGADQSPFEDVTEKLGMSFGGCVAWGDFDNDGWVDAYGDGALWRNQRGQSFVKVETANLPGGKGTWGDFNNDGLLDLFTATNGRLYQGLPGGGFKDVSDILPTRGEHVSQAASWGDVNGDGFLDLYYTGYEVWDANKEYPDYLYLNEGGVKFTEFWQTPKVLRARGVTTADFDRDGDLDLYVSNYRLQPNNLWRNDGKGHLTDVGAELHVDGDGDLGAWGHTIGSCWGDLDNDGWLDLFVGNFSHPPAYQDRPKFLRNMGPAKGFQFEDRSADAGLAWQESFASPTLGDYDNDGDLDLYYTAVYGGDHNVLYRNDGNWKFTNVTDQAALTRANTYQAAWMDFDNDGYFDLMTGGRVYRNRGNAGHRLRITLIGGAGVDRTAIGTQVRVLAGGGFVTRQVEASTGEGNQNDMTLHFGLGATTGPVLVEVRWLDGLVQVYTLPVDHHYTIARAAGSPAP